MIDKPLGFQKRTDEDQVKYSSDVGKKGIGNGPFNAEQEKYKKTSYRSKHQT